MHITSPRVENMTILCQLCAAGFWLAYQTSCCRYAARSQIGTVNQRCIILCLIFTFQLKLNVLFFIVHVWCYDLFRVEHAFSRAMKTKIGNKSFVILLLRYFTSFTNYYPKGIWKFLLVGSPSIRCNCTPVLAQLQCSTSK